MLVNMTFLPCCANMLDDSFDKFKNNFTDKDNISMKTIISDHQGGFGMPSNLMNLAVMLLRSFTAVVGFSIILLNCVVFAATTKACPKALKSKAFIQNSILADISWGVVSCYPVVSYILKAYQALEISHVFASINNHISPTIMYSQLLSALLLVCDRLYAVLRPLTYHTVGYSTLAKVLLIASSWLGAVALTLPGIIIPFFKDELQNSSWLDKLNYAPKHITNEARPYTAISINVLIFLLYIAIFVVLDLQNRCNRVLGTQTSDSRRKTLSLTITYFLINISSLCLYLPGPVFKYVRASIPRSVMSNDAKSAVNRTLINLYMFNSVLNPLILGSRVRVIRQYLVAVIKPRRHQTTRNSKRTDSPKGQS